MANHKSALRQWRRSLRRRMNNRQTKAKLRTQIKKLRYAIQEKDRETARNLLPQTFSVIDQSIKKGAIHKNTGDRYKSRLSHQVEQINPAPSK